MYDLCYVTLEIPFVQWLTAKMTYIATGNKMNKKRDKHAHKKIFGCYFREGPPNLVVGAGKFQIIGSACGQHEI
jgi:hypothetical protein